MTKVVHCKKENYDYYIGRPSKYGNPFVIGSHGDREEVIAKYEDYILKKYTPEEIASDLSGKVLGCWCKPHRCHGDVLVSIVESVND